MVSKPLFIGLVIIFIILICCALYEDYRKCQILRELPEDCSQHIIDIHRQSTTKKMVFSSMNGAFRGGLMGYLLMGPAGAVTNGIAFALINPVMMHIEGYYYGKDIL